MLLAIFAWLAEAWTNPTRTKGQFQVPSAFRHAHWLATSWGWGPKDGLDVCHPSVPLSNKHHHSSLCLSAPLKAIASFQFAFAFQVNSPSLQMQFEGNPHFSFGQCRRESTPHIQSQFHLSLRCRIHNTPYKWQNIRRATSKIIEP